MAETKSKAECVRDYLRSNPRAKNNQVVEALAKKDIHVTSVYVNSVKTRAKKSKKSSSTRKPKRSGSSVAKNSATPKYPRHSLEKALRIPQAILEQNAGKECSVKESAGYLGLRSAAGPYAVEISSAKKYGLLEQPKTRRIGITDLSRKILRPQNPADELEGLREAALLAPDISDVYKHYRGENLPDEKFLDHALEDTFHIPRDKLSEFKTVFRDTLQYAQLLQERDGKFRVFDFAKGGEPATDSGEMLKKLGKTVEVDANDTCFVMMPFALPHGSYYQQVYEPAIKKAGLKPIRADNEIFGTGKIMDQIWSGINNARVLVAELTTKNPNVFYELGLAHALKKPVVLISSNDNDVPFDVRHIRVIYYDMTDPSWGKKLADKVAENVLSAIRNPEEAIFKGEAMDLQ